MTDGGSQLALREEAAAAEEEEAAAEAAAAAVAEVEKARAAVAWLVGPRSSNRHSGGPMLRVTGLRVARMAAVSTDRAWARAAWWTKSHTERVEAVIEAVLDGTFDATLDAVLDAVLDAEGGQHGRMRTGPTAAAG